VFYYKNNYSNLNAIYLVDERLNCWSIIVNIIERIIVGYKKLIGAIITLF